MAYSYSIKSIQSIQYIQYKIQMPMESNQNVIIQTLTSDTIAYNSMVLHNPYDINSYSNSILLLKFIRYISCT